MADGLKIGQVSGVWITGASAPTTTAGVTLNQLTGVWITGSPASVSAAPAAISWLRLAGVWVTGGSTYAAPAAKKRGAGHGGDPGSAEDEYTFGATDFNTYMAKILVAIVEVINGQ